MQDVDCFFELGDVHHAVDAARILDADLFSAGANNIERPPVYRIKANLDPPQLEACFVAVA